MFGENKVSDRELAKTVGKKIQRSGAGGLTADVQQGTVTIRGKIRYESQRRTVLKIVNSIVGVRRVIDQIQLQSRQPAEPRHRPAV